MSTEFIQVGESLRRARRQRDLTLADVAEQAGISPATLSRIETNKQRVDVSVLMKLAGILGVPPAELFREGEDEDLHALAGRLSRLNPLERATVIREASRHDTRQQLASRIEELLQTVDLLREELVSMQRHVPTARRARARR